MILATAAISEAKRLFPDAKIDVIVKQGNESLLRGNPHINEVFVFDKSNGKIKELRRFRKIFKSASYDITFNFHRFGSSGILTYLSGAKKRYGFKKNPFSFLFTKSFEHQIGDGTHEVTRNMSMLFEFGASDQVKPQLFPAIKDWEITKRFKSTSYYCIAPASVWFTKQLPAEKWVELIKKLGSDSPIYLLGAPNDSALCSEIIEQSKVAHVYNLAGTLSLLESASLIADAKRTFVNDSAPLHIASSMNAPVTAFFLSTVTAFGFGPLSDDATIKEVHGLSCKPCGLHGHAKCPLNHFDCSKIEI